MSVEVTISALDKASGPVEAAAAKLHGLEASLRKAASASEEFRSRWEQTIKVSESAGRGMMVAGGAILGLGAMAVKAGSDFVEMSSMFDQVFKGQAAGVRSWADATAEATNRSAADLQKYAASFQGLFVPMGFDRGPAAQMSETVSQLAVDLGSFWNAQEPDVIRDLQSAFAGESEAMRKYGVFLSDAALDQELFNRGIKGGSEAATEAEKAQARLAIIMRATGDAQGDAARTSGSLENQLRGLKAELTEIAVGAGQALVPVLEELAPVMKETLESVSDFIATPAGEEFVKWAAGAALVTTGTGLMLQNLGSIATGIVSMGSLGRSAWDLFTGKAKEAAEAAEDVSSAMGSTLPKVSKLDSLLGSVGLTTTSAAIGIGALAIGIMEYGREAEAARAATEAFNRGLADIAAGKASEDLQKWTADLREAAEAAREADNAARGGGGNGSGLPGDPESLPQQEREHEAMVERSLRKLQEQEETARQRMQGLQRGSVEYLRAEAEAIAAHLGQLAIEREELTRKPLWRDPRPQAITPSSIGAALDKGNRQRQQLQDVKREADIYAAEADRVAQSLSQLTDAQSKSEQLTKAQTKAIADAVKAADVYADSTDAMRDATKAASETMTEANKRVVEAQAAVVDAVQDAADRIGDAQEDLADAVADATERVDDAREREAEAADHLRDVEDKAAKARVDIEQDAADRIADIHDSTEQKVASLVERLGELHGKLREQTGGQSNVFRINGRDVLLSDAEADKLRARQKLLADIAKVQRQITEARAEEQRKVGDVEGDLTGKLSEHDAGTADAMADARKSLADAQEATRKASIESARRVVDAEEALANAKAAATEAINNAEQKRLEAEAQRARTYAQISEKLTDAAEKLGRAWMALEDSGKQAPGGVVGAMSRADRDRRAATSIGMGIAGSTTTSDVQGAMAAFASVAGTAAPMRSYQTLARTHGPRIALPALPAGGPSMAAPMYGQQPVALHGGQGMAAGGGMGGGAARVVIGLEPGLVARELQQDPARGVVVQITRATGAKTPGRSTY